MFGARDFGMSNNVSWIVRVYAEHFPPSNFEPEESFDGWPGQFVGTYLPM